MEIGCKAEKNKIYIFFVGELDEYSSSKVKQKVDKIIDQTTVNQSVIFDFSQTSFMDSTGIGVLLGRYKKLKKLGIKGYVYNPSFQVDKILQISGIYDVMPKYKRG
ncbi:MAG: anti-sigma factor antagonist [Clostridia bacterium]|nr:anti-sigma factor antagonist [Clostridia bacterium]